MKPYYEKDGIVIYHGDCRDILPALTYAAIVSDPPYGMDYEHGARRGGIRYGQDGRSIVGDQEPFNPAHLLSEVPTVLWGGNHFADRLPASRGWLVWHKRNPGESNDQSDCELAWTNFLTTARVFVKRWSGGHREGREQQEGRFHVNQKPVALIHWCLDLVRPTGVVIDPYLGSGTTLVACKERGLKAIGIEIEEANCEIAAQRLAQDILPLEVA